MVRHCYSLHKEVTMIYLVRHIVEQRTDINKEAINRTTQLLSTYKNWK